MLNYNGNYDANIPKYIAASAENLWKKNTRYKNKWAGTKMHNFLVGKLWNELKYNNFWIEVSIYGFIMINRMIPWFHIEKNIHNNEHCTMFVHYWYY